MMQYLDKLIPLAILVAIGVMVFFLLRRLAREHKATPPVDASPIRVVSADSLAPAEVGMPELIAAEKSQAIKSSEGGITTRIGPSKKPRRVRAPITATPAAKSPIISVLGLLQEEDALAAAFLLGEILAPPVSRRQ